MSDFRETLADCAMQCDTGLNELAAHNGKSKSIFEVREKWGDGVADATMRYRHAQAELREAIERRAALRREG